MFITIRVVYCKMLFNLIFMWSIHFHFSMILFSNNNKIIHGTISVQKNILTSYINRLINVNHMPDRQKQLQFSIKPRLTCDPTRILSCYISAWNHTKATRLQQLLIMKKNWMLNYLLYLARQREIAVSFSFFVRTFFKIIFLIRTSWCTLQP